MKIAICFSGQTRFIEEGYKTLSKNLIGFNDMDIFVHTWSNSTSGNHALLTTEEPPQKIFNYYNITDFLIEEQRYDIAPQLQHEIFVHYSMFYSIHACNLLKKLWETTHNIKYDYVIRTRFDIALLSKLDIREYSNKVVNSPDVCGNPNVISDWFNFSGSQIIDTYSDIYLHMNEYKSSGVNMQSGEEIILNHLNNHDISTQKIDTDLRLIRKHDTSIKNWIGINSLRNLL